jgi:hypothetical protein
MESKGGSSTMPSVTAASVTVQISSCATMMTTWDWPAPGNDSRSGWSAPSTRASAVTRAVASQWSLKRSLPFDDGHRGPSRVVDELSVATGERARRRDPITRGGGRDESSSPGFRADADTASRTSSVHSITRVSLPIRRRLVAARRGRLGTTAQNTPGPGMFRRSHPLVCGGRFVLSSGGTRRSRRSPGRASVTGGHGSGSGWFTGGLRHRLRLHATTLLAGMATAASAMSRARSAL